jgi:hypothetical protein
MGSWDNKTNKAERFLFGRLLWRLLQNSNNYQLKQCAFVSEQKKRVVLQCFSLALSTYSPIKNAIACTERIKKKIDLIGNY